MSNLSSICHQLAPLTSEASFELEKAWTEKSYAKNQLIVNSEKICSHLYFIERGFVKLFSQESDKQFIMRFSAENSCITIIDSFLLIKPSKYKLIALEDTLLKKISKREMEHLCSKHHSLEHLFRNLIGMASVNMMQRIHEILEDNAYIRYHNFVNQHPNLLQRIKLGDLAAYMGVTQTTLSRIRAKK